MLDGAACRGGFTLVEQIFAVALLVLVLGASTRVFSGANDAATAQNTRADTVEDLNRGLRSILDDLKFSGNSDFGGTTFPALFEDGNAGGSLGIHNHAAPNGSGASVTSREVVFLLLADDDGDGVPDVGADSSGIWGADEFSYVLIPDADGTNRIERRINGVLDRIVLRGVDSMLIDDRASSGFTVPFGSLRVTITGTRVDTRRRAYTETVVGTVALRNTQAP